MEKTDLIYSEEMFKRLLKITRCRNHRRPIKYWPDVWRRLKQDKLAMVGLGLLIIMGIMSIVGTHISGFKYYEQDYSKINVNLIVSIGLVLMN